MKPHCFLNYSVLTFNIIQNDETKFVPSSFALTACLCQCASDQAKILNGGSTIVLHHAMLWHEFKKLNAIKGQ